MPTQCSRGKCTNVARQRGLCEKHLEVFRRTHYPKGAFADASMMMAHLERLHAAGMTDGTIARHAGVHFSTLRNFTAGRRTRAHVATIAAVLAIPVPERIEYVTEAPVPNTGTQRRLRALIAIGYTNRQLAAGIGLEYQGFERLIYGDFDVMASTARAASEVFDRLQLVIPPDNYGSRRARLRAERHGWVGPLYWDEESIDDPQAQPYRPARGANGRTPLIEQYHEALHVGLITPNMPHTTMADRMGVDRSSLQTALMRERRQEQQAS